MFCKYQNIFGEVNKGVHRFRILDIAIVDVCATILFAYIIHFLFPQLFIEYNFIIILATLFLIGIVMHRLFCVRTTIDKLLFT